MPVIPNLLNWPQVTHEINTTRQPNDPGGTDTWIAATADITEWTTKRGRQDELADVQTGTMDWTLINDQGRYDPNNASSSLYPNLKAWRQVRTICSWSGTTYSVFSGYEETFWPQSWTENGTKGWCKPTFVDAFAALGKITLDTVVLEEMLADDPLALYPLGDGGLYAQAGNISATQQANAQATNTGTGLTYAIVSPPGFLFDGVNTATFGGEAMVPTSPGTSLTFTTADSTGGTNANHNHAGAYLQLPAGSFPTSLGSGMSIEFWFQTDAITGTGSQVLLFQASDGGSNKIQFWVGVSGGTEALLTTSGGTGSSLTTASYADGHPHHVVMTLDATGKNLLLYIDGVQITYSVTAASVALAPAGMSWSLGQISVQSTSTAVYTTSFEDFATYTSVLTSTQASNHYRAGSTGFAGDTASTRVGRLLDYAVWRSDLRNLDTTSVGDSGTLLTGADDLTPSTVLLQALKDTVSSVQGELDVDGSGKVRYRSRDHRLAQTTPAYTFGENTAAGELPYVDLPETGAKPDYLFSAVQVNQHGGITVNRGSAAAALDYFPSTLQRDDVVLQDPGQIVDLADDLNRRYNSPHERAASFTLDPASNPNLWPAVLGMDYGTRIRVMRRSLNQPAKTIDCYVESISHHVNHEQGIWQTTVTTSAAPPFTPWLLGDSTYGVLGTTTAPTF